MFTSFGTVTVINLLYIQQSTTKGVVATHTVDTWNAKKFTLIVS